MATVLERPRYATPLATTEPTYKFIIESGVPLPPRTYPGSGRPTLYPFALMEVGDSFEVHRSDYNDGTKPLEQVQSGLGNLARNYAKTHRRYAKFTTRKTGDSTIRIWRVA